MSDYQLHNGLGLFMVLVKVIVMIMLMFVLKLLKLFYKINKIEFHIIINVFDVSVFGLLRR